MDDRSLGSLVAHELAANRRWKRHFTHLYDTLSLQILQEDWYQAHWTMTYLLEMPRDGASSINRHLLARTWNIALRLEHHDDMELTEAWARNAVGLAHDCACTVWISRSTAHLASIWIERGDIDRAKHALKSLDSTGTLRWMLELRAQLADPNAHVPVDASLTLRRIFEAQDFQIKDVGRILKIMRSSQRPWSLFCELRTMATRRWPQSGLVFLTLVGYAEEAEEWQMAYELIMKAIQNGAEFSGCFGDFLPLAIHVSRELWFSQNYEQAGSLCEGLGFTCSGLDGCTSQLYTAIINMAVSAAHKVQDWARVRDLLDAFPVQDGDSRCQDWIRLDMCLQRGDEEELFDQITHACRRGQLSHEEVLLKVWQHPRCMELSTSTMLRIWKLGLAHLDQPHARAKMLQIIARSQLENLSESPRESNQRESSSPGLELLQLVDENIDCVAAHPRLAPWFSQALWNLAVLMVEKRVIQAKAFTLAARLIQGLDAITESNCLILSLASHIDIIDHDLDFVDKTGLLITLDRIKTLLQGRSHSDEIIKKNRLSQVMELKLALTLKDLHWASKTIEKALDDASDKNQEVFGLFSAMLHDLPHTSGFGLDRLKMKSVQGALMGLSLRPCKNSNNSARTSEMLALFYQLFEIVVRLEDSESLIESSRELEAFLAAQKRSPMDESETSVLLVKALWNSRIRIMSSNPNFGSQLQSTVWSLSKFVQSDDIQRLIESAKI